MRTPVNPLNPQLTSSTAGVVRKYFTISRSDTAGVDAIGLPYHLIPITATIQSLGAVSNAATTATIQLIDKASTSVLATLDAKTAKTDLKVVDVQPLLALEGKDTWIQLKYAETGTASTAGGPWLVSIEFQAVG